jgi:hemoglobin-like flavoprotein
MQQSLHHILERRDSLADLFYLVFLDRYPDVRRHFEGVDLKHQGALLTMALMVIERHYTHSYAATELYLQYLGTKHKTRGIPIDLYPPFADAMLASLERFHGKDWSPELARQWQEALDKALETMILGYENHCHV